jgi:hypothetical protein
MNADETDIVHLLLLYSIASSYHIPSILFSHIHRRYLDSALPKVLYFTTQPQSHHTPINIQVPRVCMYLAEPKNRQKNTLEPFVLVQSKYIKFTSQVPNP